MSPPVARPGGRESAQTRCRPPREGAPLGNPLRGAWLASSILAALEQPNPHRDDETLILGDIARKAVVQVRETVVELVRDRMPAEAETLATMLSEGRLDARLPDPPGTGRGLRPASGLHPRRGTARPARSASYPPGAFVGTSWSVSPVWTPVHGWRRRSHRVFPAGDGASAIRPLAVADVGYFPSNSAQVASRQGRAHGRRNR